MENNYQTSETIVTIRESQNNHKQLYITILPSTCPPNVINHQSYFKNFATSTVSQKQSNGDALWDVLYTALFGFERFGVRW